MLPKSYGDYLVLTPFKTPSQLQTCPSEALEYEPNGFGA